MKSSGKTTLLYHFLELLSKKSKIDIKFLNLRKILIVSYKDFLKVFFGMDYNAKDDVKEIREYDVRIFSEFFEVNYLSCEDTFEWLNIEKYSKIKEFTLTKEQAQKIWDTVGGSMWEILER